ncbi:Fcf2 pre-rRNA processing protein [Chloropicon primus]|uniref:Fcf2 pre-rRNA processing protein n=1 Tax=Chloropicon primus TaxID=1764295 RepID=A0A5B8MUC1_9CHLO|nr:Fcf2 pre-rRNA processing protein [Chloropicon primus]UPR02256.1 Fcf2 pre-rRNA processing protein [Chloropicon primus]|eukprot:QDZ23042.1 Fcf2 pre-rRNA processing protein [Chloropicon primus]
MTARTRRNAGGATTSRGGNNEVEDQSPAAELLAAVKKRKEEQAGGLRGGEDAAEGIEWRSTWKPSTGLPGALDAATAAKESFEVLLKSRNEESFRRQKAIKAHAEIPEQEITPEVKRDFRLLKLRGVMDPKRFYKGSDERKIPKRFQWGRVIEGPTEFYSSRMTKKERKQTLTEEILADNAVTTYRKRKFGELQAEARKSATRQGSKQPKRKPRKRTSHKGYRG